MADYAVPGEYAMDPEIQDLMNSTHELQRAFVEAHKECERARREAKDPVKLKSQIADLEREREQVRRRIEVTKGKVAQRVTDPRELDELVALAQSLREEQAQEHELARQTRDQTERRELADRRRNRALARSRELRTSLASGPRRCCCNSSPTRSTHGSSWWRRSSADLAKKRARLGRCGRFLRRTWHRLDIADRRLRLTNSPRRCASSRTNCRRLWPNGTRTSSSASRRRWPRRSRLTRERRAKRDRLAQREPGGWWASTSPRPRARRATAPRQGRRRGRAATDPDEMKARFESVKAKLAKYKSLKRELDAAQHGRGGARRRTEAILEEDARGDGRRRRGGAQGGRRRFAQAQETLEHVSR